MWQDEIGQKMFNSCLNKFVNHWLQALKNVSKSCIFIGLISILFNIDVSHIWFVEMKFSKLINYLANMCKIFQGIMIHQLSNTYTYL
jgi:hypothetical protein